MALTGYAKLQDRRSKTAKERFKKAKTGHEYAKSKLNGYDGIYIHRNWMNFQERNNVYNIYMQQKQQEYSKMKTRFMNNYLNSISIEDDSIKDLIELAEQDKEAAINAIDKELQDNLIKGIEKSVKSGVDEILSKKNLAYQILKEAFAKAEVDAEKLNTLSSVIEDTGKIITNHAVGAAAAIRGVNKKSNKELPKGIDSILRANDLGIVSGQDILETSNNFKNLKSKLEDIPPSFKSIKQYLNGIFSTDFGEGGGLIFILKALQELGQSVQDAVLMGSAQHRNTKSGPLFDLAQSGSTTTYKADIGIEGLKIKVNEQEMNINLGFSVKTYKAGDSHVQITGESHLSNRVSQLFGNSSIWNYIMYNTLAHTKQDPQSYSAIKQLLVARNLDVAMAGIGLNRDFSQFLLINGSFYSTWEIVKKIKECNYGGGFRSNTNDIVTVNFPGIKTVEEETSKRMLENPPSIERAFDNSRKQIYTIDSLEFQMNFFPSKLKKI